MCNMAYRPVLFEEPVPKPADPTGDETYYCEHCEETLTNGATAKYCPGCGTENERYFSARTFEKRYGMTWRQAAERCPETNHHHLLDGDGPVVWGGCHCRICNTVFPVVHGGA